MNIPANLNPISITVNEMMPDPSYINGGFYTVLPNPSVDLRLEQLGGQRMPYPTNCTAPGLPNAAYGACVPSTASFSPDQPLVFRIPVVSSMLTISVTARSTYFTATGLANKTVTSSNDYYMFGNMVQNCPVTKLVEIVNEQRKEYLNFGGCTASYDPNSSDNYRIQFWLNDYVIYRSTQQITIGDIFMRVWGLNLMFFMVMAVYITNYNRKIAKKETGRKYCSKPEEGEAKGEEIMKINTLLLFLRSKCETLDENLFYKENITPAPALTDSVMSSP